MPLPCAAWRPGPSLTALDVTTLGSALRCTLLCSMPQYLQCGCLHDCGIVRCLTPATIFGATWGRTAGFGLQLLRNISVRSGLPPARSRWEQDVYGVKQHGATKAPGRNRNLAGPSQLRKTRGPGFCADVQWARIQDSL